MLQDSWKHMLTLWTSSHPWSISGGPSCGNSSPEWRDDLHRIPAPRGAHVRMHGRSGAGT
jgi:hypothetical protein